MARTPPLKCLAIHAISYWKERALSTIKYWNNTSLIWIAYLPNQCDWLADKKLWIAVLKSKSVFNYTPSSGETVVENSSFPCNCFPGKGRIKYCFLKQRLHLQQSNMELQATGYSTESCGKFNDKSSLAFRNVRWWKNSTLWLPAFHGCQRKIVVVPYLASTSRTMPKVSL